MGFFGMLLGKVDVETPDHVIVHKADEYQVWRYPAQVAAKVYARDLPKSESGQLLSGNELSNKAFPILARYIGVFRDPENQKASTDESSGEKVAMTAPVVMTGDDSNKGEKVDMTAPVVMSGGDKQDDDKGEKVAMTAPVVMSGGDSETSEKVDMTAPVVMSGGDNTDGEKIDMTAPVEMGAGNEEGPSMKFLLPSKYKSVEEAPIPTNPAVKLEMVEGGRCEAVFSFSGSFDMKAFNKKAKECLKILEEGQINVTGEWTYQGYNPPFTLPWLRRNEIHVPIDPTPYLEVEGEPKE